MWFQFIYWFRLFDRTTLYVRLIIQTIYDMKWFFFIFVLVTMCFANAIYILNASRMQDSFGTELFDETFPSFAYVSAILNQYLVALGDWDTENYAISTTRSSTNSYLVWLLFVFTTFFSQIVIFNILIAIMGDTYDSVFANMEKAKLKLKIEVMSDYVFVVRDEKQIKKFLFVATPTEDKIETEAPFGVMFSAIRSMIKSNLENIKDSMRKMTSTQTDNAG